MNKHSAAYRRRLKRRLNCGGPVKKRLVEEFDSMLSSFLEDHPAPTAEQLEEGFGPPEHVAEILMNGVTPEEQAQYRRTRLATIITACVLVVAFVGLTIYTYFLQRVPL